MLGSLKSTIPRGRALVAPGLVLAVLGLSAPAQSAPPKRPKIGQLFGCPLAAVRQAPAKTTAKHKRHVLKTVGVELSFPAWLKPVRNVPQRVDFASKSWRVSLRITAPGPSKESSVSTLKRLKTAFERTELGPSFMAPKCEHAVLSAWIPPKSAALRRVRMGSYRRPLGLRRRDFALFATLWDGRLMTVIATGRWKSNRKDVDHRDVRAILGAVLMAKPVLTGGGEVTKTPSK